VTDWLPGTLNNAGVYCPTEVLRLPRDRKGWLGMDRCSIELCQTDEGWRSALNFQFFTGDLWGRGEPLSASGSVHATRAAAIGAKVEWMRARFANISGGHEKEAREILAWADGLNPSQGDLFGSLAA
jgi:hypothetical protein